MELKCVAGEGACLSRLRYAAFTLIAIGCLALGLAPNAGLPSPAATAPGIHAPRSAGQSDLHTRSPLSAALAAYSQLPLSFEPNLGQTDPRVVFLAHGNGYGLFLGKREAVLALRDVETRSTRTIRLRLLNANPAPAVAPLDRQPGVSNYIIGSDRSRWRCGVPQYARVRFEHVYPGVQLVYYGTRRRLEYDFIAGAGARVSNIRFRVDGASQLLINRQGDLQLRAGSAQIALRRPVAYQHTPAGRSMVAVRYKRIAPNVFAFAIGNYDRSRELVIDPQLVYSTYLGGTADETSPSVAVDSALNAYITGTTTSTDFPTVTPQQASKAGTSNIFITKLNPTGTALTYSTYLGGTGADQAAGIAVDSAFNVFVTGTTTSANFPTLHAFQASPKTAGVQHAFVAALNPTGALSYGTYLSGSNVDIAAGIAVNPSATGKPYVAGRTQSADFPTTPGVIQPSLAAGVTNAFFVAKLDTGASGSGSLIYSTYLAGTQPAGATVSGGGIAVDSVGDAYLTGGTTFTNFPVVNAVRATPAGHVDAVVTKLNKNAANPPIFSTYLGGATGDDVGNAIAVDLGGNAYITGSTTSTDYPAVAAAGTSIFQSANAGGSDAFVTKLSAGGGIVYSTYLGGSGSDSGNAIAVDPAQFAYVTGTTASANFKTLNAPFAASGGGASDAFLAKFDTSGTAQFSTYLGGSGADRGTGVAVDGFSEPFVVGDTTSANFPTTAGSYRTTPVGGSDAFVTKFTGVADLSVTAAVAPNPIGIGNPATFTYTVTNNGPDEAAGVVLSDALPASGTTFSGSATGAGSCAAPAGTPSTVVCSLGAIPVGASATVTIQLNPSVATPLSNSATITSATIDSNSANNTATATVPVTDFALSGGPASATIAAGQAAAYTITISPQPVGSLFTNSVSLTCAGGLPGNATCSFSTNPITPNASPVTSSLTISTVARPATTARVLPAALRAYALFLPVGGFVVISLGLRRRRGWWTLAALLALTMVASQLGCGSSNKVAPATGGTPAGTYTFTVQGTSGTVGRTTVLTLTVK